MSRAESVRTARNLGAGCCPTFGKGTCHCLETAIAIDREINCGRPTFQDVGQKMALPTEQNTARNPDVGNSYPGSAPPHGPLTEPDMQHPESFVDEALRVVRGNREGVYGKPTQNFDTIAALWSAWLSTRLKSAVSLEAADVGHLMILMKEARLANAPRHRDSMVDIVGYSDCIDMCWRDKP